LNESLNHPKNFIVIGLLPIQVGASQDTLCGCTISNMQNGALCAFNLAAAGFIKQWSAMNSLGGYFGVELAMIVLVGLFICLIFIRRFMSNLQLFEEISLPGKAAPLPSLASRRNARMQAIQRALHLPQGALAQPRQSIYVPQSQWSCSAVCWCVH
jgi:hypothetical protein